MLSALQHASCDSLEQLFVVNNNTSSERVLKRFRFNRTKPRSIQKRRNGEMRIHYRRLVVACGIIAMTLSVTACNTTKATIDTTVKFFSSTSPDSLFTADLKEDNTAHLKTVAALNRALLADPSLTQ